MVGYLIGNGFFWVVVRCQVLVCFGMDVELVGFKQYRIFFIYIDNQFIFLVFQVVDEFDFYILKRCQVLGIVFVLVYGKELKVFIFVVIFDINDVVIIGLEKVVNIVFCFLSNLYWFVVFCWVDEDILLLFVRAGIGQIVFVGG